MTPAGDAPTPYIPTTAADREAMLARIGVESTAALFADLPAAYRDPPLTLPPALPEADLIALLRDRAGENQAARARPVFLGAGAYRRAVPSVTASLASRSEFMTAYTPYQPEISQGTLQSAFEYQSVVCELTGMNVSNTGLYDAASATAEAVLLAGRATKRRTVAVLEPLHPHTLDVIRTYAGAARLRVDVITTAAEVVEEHACVVAQQPDFLGAIADVDPLAQRAHAVGALCVVMADPLALGLLRAPGDAGADIVTGEGRDLAGPLEYGGPSLGLFAARAEFLRQMPGRIVGRTRELAGPALPGGETGAPRTGYVLTLQAREQFIRRERATSNISTGQSLLALAFTITVQALGPAGLRQQAETCYQRAHDAAARIAAIPGYQVVERGPWFQEFLVRGPLPAPELQRRLSEHGNTGGLDVSGRPEPAAQDAVLFCVTEATPPQQVEQLLAALAEIGGPA